MRTPRWLITLVGLVAVLVMFPGSASAATPSDFTQIGQLVNSGSGEDLAPTALASGMVFAGAPDTSLTRTEQGAVFAYPEAAGPGAAAFPAATLVASDASAGDGLGAVVATDGQDLVTANAAPTGRGVVRIFSRPAGGWSGVVTQNAELVAPHGVLLYSPTVSGATIVALGSATAPDGTLGQTLLYVFTKPAVGWSGTVLPSAVLVPPAGASITNSGSAVAIGQGEIVAGSAAASAAYVFEAPTSGWSGVVTPAAVLSVPGTKALGWSVLLAGSSVVVGLSQDVVAHQGAYVFDRPAAGWTSEGPVAHLVDANAYSMFPGPLYVGSAAMLFSGTSLLIPISPKIQNGLFFGPGAYDVYDLPSGGWSGDVQPNATLEPSTPGSLDGLTAASFDGDDVIAGTGVSFTSVGAADTAGAVRLLAGPTVADGLVAAPGSAEVFTGVSHASGLVAPAAQLTQTGSGIAVFAKPAAGWTSETDAEALTTPGPSGATTDTSLSASGPDLAISRVETSGDATLRASTDIYTQPAAGWAGQDPPTAQLADPQGWRLHAVSLHGTTAAAVAMAPTAVNSTTPSAERIDVFSEPAGGWNRATLPTAIYSLPAGQLAQQLTLASGVLALEVSSTHLSTFRVILIAEPPRGWSGQLLSTGTIAGRGINLGTRISFSGRDMVVGGLSGGRLIASTTGGVIFSEPARGWRGTLRPSATLTVPSIGQMTWLYQEPARGWKGTLHPSGQITRGTVSFIAGTGREIGVDQPSTFDSPAPGAQPGYDLWVLTRPSDGWTGLLTGRGVNGQPLSVEATDSGTETLGDDGNYLFAPSITATGQSTDTVYRINHAPVAQHAAPAPPPRITAHLSGLQTRRPTLRIEVTARTRSAPLTRVTVTLPKGLSIARNWTALRRSIVPCQTTATCTRTRPRTLRVDFTVGFPAPISLMLALRAGELNETTSLQRSITQVLRDDRRHRRHPRTITLRLGLTVEDGSGATTSRSVRFRLR